jgi:[protein-PII] uridylyltransferase
MTTDFSFLRDQEARKIYQRRMLEIAAAFAAGLSGSETLRTRSDAVDALVAALWTEVSDIDPQLSHGVALVAIGGYGRRELFPYSDVDLLFLIDPKLAMKIFEGVVKEPIRRVSQTLWDCGLRVATVTRKLNECERFDPENTEFALALLDERLICGDAALHDKLQANVLPKMFDRDRDAMLKRLAELTSARHAKYGGTLFHLEPNIKDCPGGLRDVHVCRWIRKLTYGRSKTQAGPGEFGIDGQEFQEAVAFLELLRCFLHFRHERDNNTLDWQAQDAAAAAAIGLNLRGRPAPDASYWMRLYFRNARVVERNTVQMFEAVPAPKRSKRTSETGKGGNRKIRAAASARRSNTVRDGFRIERGLVVFDAVDPDSQHPLNSRSDRSNDPETVLRMFEVMSATGCRLGMDAEQRLSLALPLISADLEEGPALWRHIENILNGHFAGRTLRSMHALGILELLIPEFHGIDALVIRDAYHRYTVDEHTFVLINSLHDLENLPSSSPETSVRPMAEWSARFGQLLRDLQQPSLLYLVALLHDTGKGRSTGDHASESVRMAQNVLMRLELDGYESNLVLRLIGNHLEMSAALRRDIFDTDTVRGFAARVQTPEALRMLTLFTYADIQAVHPDALTPWKAENLWRLYLTTSNYLDRNLDEERVGTGRERDQVLRVTAMIPERRHEVERFLEGLPARYLSTRSPEQVRCHFELSTRLDQDLVQLEFSYSPNVNDITLVTPDRSLLFANMAGALAAWGMNIVTADAFSNRHGIVVDSFRFTDSFRTLEMNVSERARFVQSVHDVVSGTVAAETLLNGRRRGRRKPPMMRIEPRVDFDDNASSQSTLLQVIAQDTPGLLRVLSLTLAGVGCNVDLALIDTEGETAIDVFYITREQAKLGASEKEKLRLALLAAIREHVLQMSSL